MKKIQNQGLIHNQRHDLDEHFTLINAIINDMMRDTADILNYITYMKEGSLHPRFTPIEKIIDSLKDAAAGLLLYFPFNLQNRE